MLKVFVCVVLPYAWRSTEEFVLEFLKEIQYQLSLLDQVVPTIVFSYESIGRENWKLPHEAITLLSHNTKSTNSAHLYLSAFAYALANGADLVLEIDASGGHDPKEIAKFLTPGVDLLKLDPTMNFALLSTRFSRGGSDSFPQDRVLLSKLGTVFAQLFLMLGRSGRELTDLTSGFEAFSGGLLAEMLKTLPPKKWVSQWWGPMHLFQTEARALVCWLAKSHSVKIYELPITFGKNFKRKLAPLAIGYLIRAFVGGFLMCFEAFVVKTQIKNREV